MDVNTTLLANTAKEIEGKYLGVKAFPITVDVKKLASAQAMVHKTVVVFGKVVYCCNSAGLFRFGSISILSEELQQDG